MEMNGKQNTTKNNFYENRIFTSNPVINIYKTTTLIRNTLVVIVCSLFFLNCNKKYERPDQYKIDLFDNELKENSLKIILSNEEALKKSRYTFLYYNLATIDSSKSAKNKSIYIYELTNGQLIKGNNKIDFPLRFISNYKIKPHSTDSCFLFIDTLRTNKLIVKDLGIHYESLQNVKKCD